MMRLLLDTNLVSEICHTRRRLPVQTWYPRMAARCDLGFSVVADYELRRELVRSRSLQSLARLDALAQEIPRVPLTDAMWRRAADVWADQVARGALPGPGISGDTLIAAQALETRAIVVTKNLKHFEGIVFAMDWTDLPIG